MSKCVRCRLRSVVIVYIIDKLVNSMIRYGPKGETDNSDEVREE